MATDSRSLVIVGASFGGLSIAHFFLKHTLPALKKSQPSTAYQVVLIDQSSHFYWHIGAPRAAVSTALLTHDQSFTPIVDGFASYASESFAFRQGTAESLDTAARTITIKTPSGTSETIPYYALVLATGANTPTPLTSLHGDYQNSKSALDTMNKRIASAKEVVIGGGGPVGVETAGEIGEALNGAAGWFKSRPEQKAKVTLVTGGKKLLPILRPALSDKAEVFLNRLGVDVVYNTKIEKVDAPESGDGKTTVHLSNGTTISADVYIPATGVTPNTAFIPKTLLDDRDYVNTDSHLRVTAAGDRVYCIGDAGNHSRGGVLNIYASVPVLSANIAADFSEDKSQEKVFTPDTSESQVVPVGRSKGVGAFKGVQTPSLMVWGIKGRDYMISNRAQMTHGTKW